MKKVILVTLAWLLLSAMPALGASKAAPKTTGGVGYEAGGLQRHIEFNAQQLTDVCNVNLDGNWTISFTSSVWSGSPFMHNWNVTGDTLNGTSTGNSYTATIEIVGKNVTIEATYRVGSAAYPYTYTASGTINPDGSLSGTWSDTKYSDKGTWSSTSGSAIIEGCSGKGMLNYKDANGDSYKVDIQYVKVEGEDAWFAGPVVSASNPSWLSYWLFAKVHDGCEPAVGVDQVSGSFTNENSAKLGVALMSNPGSGPFTVTSGNLQVH